MRGIRPIHGTAVCVGLAGLAGLAAIATGNGAGVPAADAPIAFNRQIRPILSDKCFQCHGPDSAARQAGLRLDSREGATAERDGGPAVVPGDVERSKLVRRITSDNPAFHMPPPEIDKSLTDDEKQLLIRWIEQGASWEEHWSFIPPARPPVPEVSDPAWVRNPIDAFILARLDKEGHAPSPAASPETLLRRTTLDLTGLPPSIDEMDAFLADPSDEHYARTIERLFASTRYGEHMARYWLDAARYGDTHGLHLDNDRSMWPWREWVIDAFNANMPFDQFTIEQLAGDLLPEPTRDQLIATGFNRNNVTTSEGGAIDEEYLMKYAADRVETTATVWMGLTLGCAQCHDHKFDPFSQREYYELFAYFNNVAENAMDGNQRDPPPIVRAPSDQDERKLETLRADLASHEQTLDAPDPEIDSAQQQWEVTWRDRWATRWSVLDPDEATATNGATLRELEDHSLLAEGENPDKAVYAIVARTDETDLRLLRLEALQHDELPHGGPGRAYNANFVLSEIEMEATSLADPAMKRTITFTGAAADHEQMNGPYLAEYAIDGVADDTNGWAGEGHVLREDRTAIFVADEPFGFEGGSELRIRLRFETHFTQHAIGRPRLSVSSDEMLHEELAPSRLGPYHVVGPFPANDGNEAFKMPFGPEQTPGSIDLAATYRDEELKWSQPDQFSDGVINMLSGENCATYVYRTITASTARQMEISLGSDDAIKVWLNGHIVLENNVARPAAPDQERITVDLDPGENHLLLKIVNFAGGYGFYFKRLGEGAGGELIRITKLLEAPDDALDDDKQSQIRRYYRRHHSPELRIVYDDLQDLRQQEEEFIATLPVTLVMREREERRPTHVLKRGNYDQPLAEVSPGVPAVLPPLPDDAPMNRTALAEWLVSPENPLTARVVVNRLWQQVFGVGLVETAEDFGSQGRWPSHPDLLDWLAVEFIESGWDVQHMLELMLTSNTYRQTSRFTPDLLRTDPDNRLLARGPRFRLDAEMIRDQSLHASGLLVEKTGGPSVRPYQPEGLWEAVAYPDSNTQKFVMDEGDAQYRRSMYTYWKRTAPPPNMSAFDAPNRETCIVRRARTNTPLQALVLMNDPQFVEAARNLAERALMESDGEVDGAIVRMFRLVLSRRPSEREVEVLESLFEEQRKAFAADADAAMKLLTVGQSPRDESLDPIKHAAMTNVATAILSIDEAVTKG